MAAIADFGLLGEGITYHGGIFTVKYSIPVAIRQRLSPPPNQLFRMPEDLLETIRARFDSVINGPAAGGLDPGDPLEANQYYNTVHESYTQMFRNETYIVEIKKLNNAHVIQIFRNTTSQQQQAVRPVFESVANGILQQLAASVPPAAGGRRRSRKTRKQRRRMSRRRTR
jgi:hypothetical protein